MRNHPVAYRQPQAEARDGIHRAQAPRLLLPAPLDLAVLRELGRAVRTELLLRYLDDQGLRKRIDDQLDKLESAHQFTRAVFYGQNGRFRYADKEGQQVADVCNRLVQNVVLC